MRGAVLLLLASLLSGCILGDGGDGEPPSTSILARFSEDDYAFTIVADDALPDDLQIRIQGDGVSETVLSGSITGLGTSRATFVSPLAFQDGADYTIVLTSGGATVAERSFTFLDQETLAPGGDVRAHYDVTMGQSDAEMEIEIHGAAILEQVGDDLRAEFDATGTMQGSDGPMTMQINVDEARFTDENDRTVSGHMRMSGTWSMEEDEFTASGTIDSMEVTFLGPEQHEDASGQLRDADKEHMVMQMSGTMQANGGTGTMEMRMDETSWTDADDGQAFWRTGYSETSFTFGGEQFDDREDYDEAVPPEEEDPRLMDMLPDEGPVLWPPVAGDTFVHASDDIRIEFEAKRGGQHDVAGRSTPTWEFRGSALAGASGQETIIIAASGPFEHVPLSYEMHYERGDLTASMELTLDRVV